jgi:hypothetical protein
MEVPDYQVSGVRPPSAAQPSGYLATSSVGSQYHLRIPAPLGSYPGADPRGNPYSQNPFSPSSLINCDSVRSSCKSDTYLGTIRTLFTIPIYIYVCLKGEDQAGAL